MEIKIRNLLSALLVIVFASCVAKASQEDHKIETIKGEQIPQEETVVPSKQDTIKKAPQIYLAHNRTWEFDYKNEYFPWDSTDALVVKGIVVDSDDVFYILGGNPVSIAKYKGTSLLGKRDLHINLEGSYDAMMVASDDSIYFVDEQNKTVYSLDKELECSPIAYKLPMAPEDSIAFGMMEQNTFYILTHNRNAEEIWREENHTTWCFEYPNTLKNVYRGKNCIWEMMSGYCKLKAEAEYHQYQDQIGEYRVFLNHYGYDECSVIVANADGDAIYRDLIKGLPPTATVSAYEEHYGALQSNNLNSIANDKLYLTGYNGDTYHFYILEFEIK